jgi:hypothetical protein
MKKEIRKRLAICASMFTSFLLAGVFGGDTLATRLTSIIGMGLSIGVFMMMRLDIQMHSVKDQMIHAWQRQNESQNEQIKAMDEIIDNQNAMLAILRQERGRDPDQE